MLWNMTLHLYCCNKFRHTAGTTLSFVPQRLYDQLFDCSRQPILSHPGRATSGVGRCNFSFSPRVVRLPSAVLVFHVDLDYSTFPFMNRHFTCHLAFAFAQQHKSFSDRHPVAIRFAVHLPYRLIHFSPALHRRCLSLPALGGTTLHSYSFTFAVIDLSFWFDLSFTNWKLGISSPSAFVHRSKKSTINVPCIFSTGLNSKFHVSDVWSATYG